MTRGAVAEPLGVVLPFIGLRRPRSASVEHLGQLATSLCRGGLRADGRGITVGITAVHPRASRPSSGCAGRSRPRFDGGRRPVLAWSPTTVSTTSLDVEGDPHSPHTVAGNGFVAAARTCSRARRLAVRRRGRAELTKYVPDMLTERRHEADLQLLWIWPICRWSCRPRSATRSRHRRRSDPRSFGWGDPHLPARPRHTSRSLVCHFWAAGASRRRITACNVWLMSLIRRRVVADTTTSSLLSAVPRDAALRGCLDPAARRSPGSRSSGWPGKSCASAPAAGLQVARRVIS